MIIAVSYDLTATALNPLASMPQQLDEDDVRGRRLLG
jgi:hypothetical protein